MLKFLGTLFFLISYLISAQNLTPVFHSSNAEVNRLTDLALQQMKKDENNLNALNTALKAKRKAIDGDDNLAIAKANATMGWIFLDGNNLDAAKNFVEKAFKNVEKEKNAEADAMLHHQLAIIVDKKAMPKEALRHYLKSIDFYKKNKNYLKLLQVYSEISRLYLTTGNMDSFRKYFLMTEDLLKKHPNNHMQLVFNNQKNYVLMSEKKYEEAYTLNMQSANLAHRSGIKNKAATALYNAAGALFEMNRIEEAERLVEKGIAYAKKNNLDYSDFMIGKAQIYMERGEPENVEQLYRDAINHYVKTKNVFMEMQSRKLLTDFYRKNHQSEKASEEYFSFKKLEDSLASAKQAIALKEVEYQYKDLEKEELIKSYKTSSVLKNWLIAAVASLALGIIYLFFNLRKNAALRQTLFEKKEKLLEAEKKNAIAEKIMAKKEEEKALLNEKLLLEEQKILKMERKYRPGTGLHYPLCTGEKQDDRKSTDQNG